ncbi:solute carrier family 26 protein [Flavobacteriaceae bacterium S0825]|uniref:SulP family inorganic anion transporter n=1 Tax=Gaetbulibacter sp. S0825 TaxID=2720084 RepID=UPI00142F5AD5|nr:solute carrier family 26 protein [Gaetbulibacter sp. S0825]MCK0109972.1 solute carrier family 26 protein [Flavobacteriaceae bacterium S0825]NIX65601.1 solute carrier 26 family protein [Gaetbulibacter sp. S0825]
MNLKSIFPIFSWLPNYKKEWLKGDISAGLTVGVMLIPQGMAYASIAGLPAVYGLYASIVPILIYAFLGTSRQLAVGPVAMVSLLTATAIGSFQGLSTSDYISYAILLALLVGTIQFLLGIFRLGFLVNFLSHPVVSGFTSAAALIIGLSQLKHLLGVNIPRSHHIHEIILNAVDKFNEINWISLIIGLAGIFIIIISKKPKKSLPGQLFAVIFGILAVTLFGLGNGSTTVDIVKNIPSSLPSFVIPTFNLEIIQLLLPMALTISLISFMESIAVAKAIQTKHRDYKVEPNQELISLGLANVFGSFFQSYPTTGGFSRTAVNDQAGAKTGLASIISATLIIVTLLFLTPYFYNLPKAILASVIMVAVFGLIDYKEAIHLFKSNITDFWMLIATFISTLAFGVEIGIGLGVILSLAMVLFQTTRPHTARLAKVPNTHFYRNMERFSDLEINEEILIYRFDAQLFFANTNFFKDKLYEYERLKKENLKLLIIDGESINNIDSTAIHAFEEIVSDFKSRNITVYFTGIKGPVRDKLLKSGFMEKAKPDHFFMSIQEAVDYFETDKKKEIVENNFKQYINQTNK